MDYGRHDVYMQNIWLPAKCEIILLLVKKLSLLRITPYIFVHVKNILRYSKILAFLPTFSHMHSTKIINFGLSCKITMMILCIL